MGHLRRGLGNVKPVPPMQQHRPTGSTPRNQPQHTHVAINMRSKHRGAADDGLHHHMRPAFNFAGVDE